MNTSLLTNTFAGNVVKKPTPLGAVGRGDTNKSAKMPTNKPQRLSTGKKTTTTDNSRPITQNEAITGEVQQKKEFKDTLGNKMTAETTDSGQVTKEGKKQGRNFATVQKMPIIPMADIALQMQKSPVILEKINAGALIGKTTGITAAKPGQIAPETFISTNKPTQSAQPTLGQGRIKSKIVLPDVANKLLSTNIQPEQNENTEKMQASDKTSDSGNFKTLETAKIDVTSKVILQKNAKEVTSQISADDSKTAIKTEKTTVQDKPTIPLGAKTTVSAAKPIITLASTPNQQGGKESIPETVTSNSKTVDTEQSAITNKPIIAINENQSSPPDQKVSIGQKAQAPAAEITTSGRADTGWKGHPGKTEPFEFSEKNNVPAGTGSVKSTTQKMNPQRAQLSTPQIENQNNLLASQRSNPNMEQGGQIPAGGNVQAVITAQSSTPPTPAALARPAGNTDPGTGVSEQIQESIQTSLRPGSQNVVIRLNPPELGKVAIKFSEQADGITGLLQVDKPQTRYQIQQELPELIQNLQNSGIAIKRLEVVLTNSQEQYTSKDQSSTAGQNSFSGQQSSPNPESQRNNTTYNERLMNVDNGTEFSELQTQLTDNSINMLV